MDLLLRLLTCIESPEIRRAMVEVSYNSIYNVDMRHVNWSHWMANAGLILAQNIMRENITKNQFSRYFSLFKLPVALHCVLEPDILYCA